MSYGLMLYPPSRPVLLLVLGLLLAPTVIAHGAQPAQPTVRLIATGGTISNRPGGRLTADQLVASVPLLSGYVHAESEQFANVSSSLLTVDHWLGLSKRVNALFATRPGLAGIVVTSGTDTLEETAYFLHLTVRSDRPVVLVGAMRPPNAVGYDGTANLLQAFRVAADPSSRGRGVLVVLNNEITSAREVTKNDARTPSAFSARGYGLVGIVDPDRIVFRRQVEWRHTFESEFDVDQIESLPRVDVMLSYQDAPGDLIDAAVAAGADGLVIAGTGAGAISQTQREAVRNAIASEVPVVITTRTGGGRVAPFPLRNNLNARQSALPLRIAGEDLAPVKARILLMLALTVTRSPEEIQRIFSDY